MKGSAQSRATTGMVIGAMVGTTGGFCLMQGIGYADASAPETWVTNVVTILGCAGFPLGALIFVLSLLFWIVNRPGKSK